MANADHMQHNVTFEAAKVAQNLPVDKTTTIELTAPAKPGLYRFYCRDHLQMMEGAVTVRSTAAGAGGRRHHHLTFTGSSGGGELAKVD